MKTMVGCYGQHEAYILRIKQKWHSSSRLLENIWDLSTQSLGSFQTKIIWAKAHVSWRKAPSKVPLFKQWALRATSIWRAVHYSWHTTKKEIWGGALWGELCLPAVLSQSELFLDNINTAGWLIHSAPPKCPFQLDASLQISDLQITNMASKNMTSTVYFKRLFKCVSAVAFYYICSNLWLGCCICPLWTVPYSSKDHPDCGLEWSPRIPWVDKSWYIFGYWNKLWTTHLSTVLMNISLYFLMFYIYFFSCFPHLYTSQPCQLHRAGLCYTCPEILPIALVLRISFVMCG